MKRIILCADDFGQTHAIGIGILELVRAGRLSAVSCMSEGSAFAEQGAALAGHRDAIDIGLHFNLTHRLARQHCAARPLGTVLAAALGARLDTATLTQALHAQLDKFEAVIGAAPDFVDGHQHVHIFPGIRGALLDAIAQRYPNRKPYLRNVDPRLPNLLRDSRGAFKTGLLKLLNIGFVRTARRHGLPYTRGFGGIYSLRPDEDYPALMQGWLAMARDGDLLMCHPGATPDAFDTDAWRADSAMDADDPIAASRPFELEHLRSAAFAAQLRATGAVLARFKQVEQAG